MVKRWIKKIFIHRFPTVTPVYFVYVFVSWQKRIFLTVLKNEIEFIPALLHLTQSATIIYHTLALPGPSQMSRLPTLVSRMTEQSLLTMTPGAPGVEMHLCRLLAAATRQP